MNPFEKIFNYQLLSRLEESRTFMVTAQERSWLKSMLAHPAAADAFHTDTLEKLRSILEQDLVMDTSDHLIQKVRSTEHQIYHPLLRSLRRQIMNRSEIRLTYQIKDGRIHADHPGLPYRLEYSMVKREWYLLWYHLRHRTLMSTRLKKIVSVTTEPLPYTEADDVLAQITQILDTRRSEAVIEVVPEFNRELSRILYSLSSFEKEVEYDSASDTYRVRVCLPGNEFKYLLSKIRFLGKRVRIVEGDYLMRRMRKTARMALARYGVNTTIAEEEPSL